MHRSKITLLDHLVGAGEQRRMSGAKVKINMFWMPCGLVAA
jgi:hypothetical protein